jgi:hypothetical protein
MGRSIIPRTTSLFLLWFSVFASYGQFQDQEDWGESQESSFVKAEDVQALDVNRAGPYELAIVSGIDLQQAQAIVDFIARHGPVSNFFELQSIRNLSVEALRLVSKSCRIKRTAFEGSDLLAPESTSLLYRVRFKQDLTKEPVGSPLNYFAKVDTRNQAIRLFLIAEKDAGEKGVDRIGGGLSFSTESDRFKIIVGDYRVNWGQGLVLWQGFGLGKSNMVEHVSRFGQSHQGHASSLEYDFLRGVSTEIRAKNAIIQVLYSDQRIDARIDAAGNIASVLKSGLHRTPAELSSRKSVKESVAGLRLGLHEEQFSASLYALHQRYSKRMARRQPVYAMHSLQGETFNYIGSSYTLEQGPLFLFGEGAVLTQQDFAFVQGVMLALGRKLSISSLVRSIGMRYRSPYGAGFTERSELGNEQGVYVGLAYQVSTSAKIAAYLDMYEHPWPLYQVDAPSQGRDLLINYEWRKKRSTRVRVRVKHELKSRNLVDNQPLRAQQATFRGSFRIDLRLNKESIQFDSRAELSWDSTIISAFTHTPGMLLYQEVAWKEMGRPWRLSLRTTWFQVNDWNNRIYAYERNVAGAFSLPAYQGTGWKGYMLGNYKLSRNLSVWIRYAFGQHINDQELTLQGRLKW